MTVVSQYYCPITVLWHYYSY